MGTDQGANVARLHEAGLIDAETLSAGYAEVIEGLSGDEIDVLVQAKQILVDADSNAQLDAGTHAEYFVPL
jgi:hypothetical protein